MRSRRTEPSIDAASLPAQELTPPVTTRTIVVLERPAMSAVNHQFRLARFAETFASASRTLSGWVRVSSRSPTPNRSGERRSSGKPPLSDHDQWPLCAKSGPSIPRHPTRSIHWEILPSVFATGGISQSSSPIGPVARGDREMMLERQRGASRRPKARTATKAKPTARQGRRCPPPGRRGRHP